MFKLVLLICLVKFISSQKGSSHGCFNKNNDTRFAFESDGTVDGCMISCEENFFR